LLTRIRKPRDRIEGPTYDARIIALRLPGRDDGRNAVTLTKSS